MTDTVEPATPAGLPSGLREEIQRLVAACGGGLRRLAVRTAGVDVELEWATVRPVEVSAADAAPGAAPAPGAAGPPPAGRTEVRAPLVGTFYAGASPADPPFVAVGDTVAAGDTVGIIEAMKLMNAVCAAAPGTIVEILVENGQPVEYDQPLVRIASAA